MGGGEEVGAYTRLIKEGRTAGRCSIIARGSVERSVRMADVAAVLMEILEVGDFLCEFALLEDVPNPTTYRARYPCLLLSLSRHDLRHIADLSRSSEDRKSVV